MSSLEIKRKFSREKRLDQQQDAEIKRTTRRRRMGPEKRATGEGSLPKERKQNGHAKLVCLPD